MHKFSMIVVMMICSAPAGPAFSDPLADMAGQWTGSGWVKESATSPAETVRCRLNNTYDASQDEVSVKGVCVAPGQRAKVEGNLRRRTDGTVRGVWLNPRGVGQSKVTGQATDDTISFFVNRKEQARVVHWQTADNLLRLSTVDGKDQTIQLADIDFKR